MVIVDDSAFVSEVGPLGSFVDVEANDHQGKVSLYVVRSGDTLPEIAEMYDVSPATIQWTNDLVKGAKLKVGQTLVILPIDGVQHTVKKGETIKGLAKKYKVDAQDIIDFNDVDLNESLAVGDILIIPDAEEEIATPSPTLSSNTKLAAGATPLSPLHAKQIASYPSYPGYYTHPLPSGRKTQGLHGWNGVDIGAPKGSPVFAAAEGTVILSKYVPGSFAWNGGYGNYVIIQHANGSQTLYAHMSVVRVTAGEQVAQGQRIGDVGSTGRSTGPHLHFEIRGAKNPF